jgi:hypothetical protein
MDDPDKHGKIYEILTKLGIKSEQVYSVVYELVRVFADSGHGG